MSITILIPMAGSGARFKQAGYTEPKPFIDVGGMPMIERVMDNLSLPAARFVLVARREDEARLAQLKLPAEIIFTAAPTEGAACTVLLATSLINSETPLLIANADQVVDGGVGEFVQALGERDGLIMTFPEPARDPKWSYAKVNADGLVSEVKEKSAISDHATVGIYLFQRGSDFVDAAEAMIAADDRTNGEFYTCPTYNYLIKAGGKVGIYEIEPSAMHGLGTPQDLQRYLAGDW